MANTQIPKQLSTGIRLMREWETMSFMVQHYCREKHKVMKLCLECQKLLNYGTRRLEKCRFKTNKPACVKCPVHCYQVEYRDRMRAVMRYSGVYMLWRHPVLTFLHLLEGGVLVSRTDL